ncbi:DUF6634 family protein [Aurantimonas sp. 22II-16-19i]|uniref:DUF6634 family protein n=1 Tax=Aurantimonas sp. 22II-16-19i TaxID=1317114 RepID=UPI0015937087|nr:DUF6634 family protein [Aurantimonas sp. 22II-16-19i]
MSIFITADGNTRHLDEELELLHRLVADLERIRQGDAPSRRELSQAPILDDWSLGMRLQPCLTGTVHGHPLIARGHRSVTSELHVFAPHHGYARTMSRFYRLPARSQVWCRAFEAPCPSSRLPQVHPPAARSPP